MIDGLHSSDTFDTHMGERASAYFNTAVETLYVYNPGDNNESLIVNSQAYHPCLCGVVCCAVHL